MFPVALMAQVNRLWNMLLWSGLSELACSCRQGRRMRLLAILRGRTRHAHYYWRRLSLMEYSGPESSSVLERIMWYHDVCHSGRVLEVLWRVGEARHILWHNGDLAMMT